ncbi:hypothetical protein Pmani_039437 [Petrolisthes manimaculis]|uniref:Uncharacterized protein n=1 Tax=Petrolisthes manimaculis TaxID=1843537 RepID=A0AAE1TLC3_9EUCA|nr:hypothetical protein Pmani_039437 [Petrolisthes manimaculis]
MIKRGEIDAGGELENENDWIEIDGWWRGKVMVVERKVVVERVVVERYGVTRVMVVVERNGAEGDCGGERRLR